MISALGQSAHFTHYFRPCLYRARMVFRCHSIFLWVTTHQTRREGTGIRVDFRLLNIKQDCLHSEILVYLAWPSPSYLCFTKSDWFGTEHIFSETIKSGLIGCSGTPPLCLHGSPPPVSRTGSWKPSPGRSTPLDLLTLLGLHVADPASVHSCSSKSYQKSLPEIRNPLVPTKLLNEQSQSVFQTLEQVTPDLDRHGDGVAQGGLQGGRRTAS